MYKVYKINLSAIPASAKYFYYKSGAQYVLLFTDKKPKGIKALSENEIKMLCRQEKEWLTTTKIKVNAEHIKKNEKQYSAIIGDFFSKMENELKKEAETANGTSGN